MLVMQICYGTPSIVRTKFGFQAYVKKQNPTAKDVHCTNRRHGMAFKILFPP